MAAARPLASLASLARRADAVMQISRAYEQADADADASVWGEATRRARKRLSNKICPTELERRNRVEWKEGRREGRIPNEQSPKSSFVRSFAHQKR